MEALKKASAETSRKKHGPLASGACTKIRMLLENSAGNQKLFVCHWNRDLATQLRRRYRERQKNNGFIAQKNFAGFKTLSSVNFFAVLCIATTCWNNQRFRIAENENTKPKNFTASVLAQTHSPFNFQKTEKDGIIAKSLKEARSEFQWGFNWFGLFTAAHLDLGLGLPWQPARTGGRAWGGRKHHLWRG